jgi:hypothetical protein
MVYQFKTVDDELFVLNTETMRWGRASSLLAAPSITAAEHKLAQFVYSEEGDLIPMGGGVYNLDGRTPQTQGPGAGLSSVGLMAIPFGDTLVYWLQANVPLKKDSFTSNPIKTTKYQIMGQEDGGESAVVDPAS